MSRRPIFHRKVFFVFRKSLKKPCVLFDQDDPTQNSSSYIQSLFLSRSNCLNSNRSYPSQNSVKYCIFRPLTTRCELGVSLSVVIVVSEYHWFLRARESETHTTSHVAAKSNEWEADTVAFTDLSKWCRCSLAIFTSSFFCWSLCDEPRWSHISTAHCGLSVAIEGDVERCFPSWHGWY